MTIKNSYVHTKSEGLHKEMGERKEYTREGGGGGEGVEEERKHETGHDRKRVLCLDLLVGKIDGLKKAMGRRGLLMGRRIMNVCVPRRRQDSNVRSGVQRLLRSFVPLNDDEAGSVRRKRCVRGLRNER